MQEEKEILRKHIVKNELRNTPQRYNVLEVFLKQEGHLSVDELHDMVKKEYSGVSHSTTFRTMKIIESAGLATKFRGSDSVLRFEHRYNHSNHGHLVCLSCGNISEFDNKALVEIQNKIAKKYGFQPLRYGTKVSGICAECQHRGETL